MRLSQGVAAVLLLASGAVAHAEVTGTVTAVSDYDFRGISLSATDPALQGSILSGITRMSCIELLRSRGMKVTERAVSIDEIAQAVDDGRLSEAFGSGTAAVISPIGELKWGNKNMIINRGSIGPVSQNLYDSLTGIQWGVLPDTFGWTLRL